MTATHPPFISRWAGILLRRALLTHSQTPTDIDGADWVAARAWLLLRMGESDNARRLIQDVDSDQYTKSLYGVAMQIYLATADPAGFCGLLPRALDFSKEPSWFMAQAICASFSADQKTASNLLRQAARRGIAHGIDYRLAEKVVGAGPDSRRSVDIEWTGVNRLTAWRFGLATATNVTIPPALYGTAGLRVRAWEAQAPTLDLATRRRGAEIATRLGVFSGAAALGYYDQLAALPDADNDARDIGDLLNAAYHGPTILGRVSAMHKFWSRNPINGNAASGPDGVYYGALPVIARAAAAIPPTSAIAGNAPWLIAAMLSGGYDRNAAHWQPVVDKLTSANRQRAWALLVTGLPNPTLDLSNRRIEAFIGQDESEDRHFGHMLIAALAGLDRVSADQRDQLLKGSDINPNPTSRWGRAILAAANRHEQGTVALLAAVGMQATDWHKFPPQNLYLVVAALHRVGLDPYARMIAAEAMARVG